MKKTLAIILSTALIMGSVTIYGAPTTKNEDGDIVDNPWSEFFTTGEIGDLEIPSEWTTTDKNKAESTVNNKNEDSTMGDKEDPTKTDKDVKKTKIKKANKKLQAKKVKISIKKVKGAKGYKLQFSKNKKFKKIIVTKTVNKAKITINSRKLKNKKKIYVRVCAYKFNKDEKIFGDWSKAKKVKIRK